MGVEIRILFSTDVFLEGGECVLVLPLVSKTMLPCLCTQGRSAAEPLPSLEIPCFIFIVQKKWVDTYSLAVMHFTFLHFSDD